MPKAVWLDCDPGHDDSLAIILAGYSPDILLLGISTVAANQAVEKVTLNALQILDAAGLSHIGVVQGQSKPIVRPRIECPGDSALPTRAWAWNGIDFPTTLDFSYRVMHLSLASNLECTQACRDPRGKWPGIEKWRLTAHQPAAHPGESCAGDV